MTPYAEDNESLGKCICPDCGNQTIKYKKYQACTKCDCYFDFDFMPGVVVRQSGLKELLDKEKNIWSVGPDWLKEFFFDYTSLEKQNIDDAKKSFPHNRINNQKITIKDI